MVAEAKSPMKLITFGSPRCGFSGLKDLLINLPTDRFVTTAGEQCDIVTTVPIIYSHHCKETPVPPKAEHTMSIYRDGMIK